MNLQPSSSKGREGKKPQRSIKECEGGAINGPSLNVRADQQKARSDEKHKPKNGVRIRYLKNVRTQCCKRDTADARLD